MFGVMFSIRPMKLGPFEIMYYLQGIEIDRWKLDNSFNCTPWYEEVWLKELNKIVKNSNSLTN